MPRKKPFFLLAALLFKAGSGLAQSPPPPAPDPGYQQVSVAVPRAIMLLTDVAKVLFSREAGQDKVQALIERRRARAEKREQGLTISVPKNRLTRTLGLVD